MSIIRRSSSYPMKPGYPPQELLDDLCSRFVLNGPEEDQKSFERLLFLVEEAHWYYEDNSVENNPSLKSISLREFTSLMFKSCIQLRPFIAHIDDIYKDFNSYKVRVPVCGAIILDESYQRCILVKGWKAGASWGFPRGKKAKDEEDHTSAIREAKEETGFDISDLIKTEDFLEHTVGEQRVRLYIIPGIKEDTVFAPRTKKEISEISWFRLDELYTTGAELVSRLPTGQKLYMVNPFLMKLKEWISTRHPQSTQKLHTYPKGKSVWKAKHNSTGGTPTQSPPTRSLSEIPKLLEAGPGNAFQSFQFDRSAILQAFDASFAAS